MKIYTLKDKVDGIESVLNGKLVSIYVCPNKFDRTHTEFRIVDAGNPETVLMQATANFIIEQIYGTTIIANNHRYEFINVDQLLPTTEDPVRVVHLSCYNGVGTAQSVYIESYRFNMSISKEKFIKLLRGANRFTATASECAARYNEFAHDLPYCEVTGCDESWTYTLTVPHNVIAVPTHILSKLGFSCDYVSAFTLGTIVVISEDGEDSLRIIDYRIDQRVSTAYEDGYIKESYVFNKPISEQEFRRELEKINRPLVSMEDNLKRYPRIGATLSYSTIDGHGENWIYTLVFPNQITITNIGKCPTVFIAGSDERFDDRKDRNDEDLHVNGES